MSSKTDSRTSGAAEAGKDAGRWLRVCSYEDRAIGMDSLILMGESLCSVDKAVSLHLTVPDAQAKVREWAASRPEVELSTERLPGLSGWNIKPSLLLQELDAGWKEALWLDSDMIVSQPISKVVLRYPLEALLLAQEWVDAAPLAIAEGWGLKSKRPISVVNNCFVRVTQGHRPMLERWLEMLHDPRYRAAQALPYDQRPKHFLHDGWPLIALLESEEFAGVHYDYIRRNGEIAQCAGSSGYRPTHRVMDVFRGLPALIHGLGRKPWEPVAGERGAQRMLLDLATDVSPYVLASRRVAKKLGMKPEWTEARTLPGKVLRGVTGGHPGLAGLPLAILHSVEMWVNRMRGIEAK
jgi:hypothetical protein